MRSPFLPPSKEKKMIPTPPDKPTPQWKLTLLRKLIKLHNDAVKENPKYKEYVKAEMIKRGLVKK